VKPLSAISDLIDLVAKETGAFDMEDADSDSVGWNEDGPLPMTFGHIRRAKAELDALLSAQKTAPESLAEIESIISRRWRENRIDGYTLEMAREIAARYILPTPKPEATEGGAHEKGIEAAARAMCEAWHYAKIGTPDGDAEWRRKQDQYRKQAKAAIDAYRAALTAKQTDGRGE
jgi:hypothetical protein